MTEDQGKETDPEASPEEEAMGDAILSAGRDTSKDTSGESETQEEKQDEGEAQKPEEAKKEETKAEEKKAEPDKASQELAQLVEEIKADPQKFAKEHSNLKGLQGKQAEELGKHRSSTAALNEWQRRLETEPEKVAQEIQQRIEQEKNKARSLLDQALDDPSVLDKEIDTRVQAAIQKVKNEERIDQNLAKTYPEYEGMAKNHEAMAQLIRSGEMPLKELVHLACLGYDREKALSDAKAEARKEDQDNLAKKQQTQVEPQAGEVGEKKEPTEEEIYQDELINVKR